MFLIVSEETVPCLIIVGDGPVTSTMVEAIPAREDSPSITKSTSSPKFLFTELDVVGLSDPLLLALVPVTATPSSRITVLGTVWLGIRKAIVSRPPDTISGTESAFLSTIVKGPGMNRVIRFHAELGISEAYFSKSSYEANSSGSGLTPERPFILYTRWIALISIAEAAKPYIVSVGRATTPPFLSTSTAISICTWLLLSRVLCFNSCVTFQNIDLIAEL